MASGRFNVLEQSTRECPDPSNAVPTANCRVNIGPTAVHPDPPTEESSAQANGNPSTRLLSHSHLQYSTIGVPVPANGVLSDPEENTVQTEAESRTNRCRTFWVWYKNTAINFRNSCYIHIMHTLFSYIPISAIIMGWQFKDECSLVSYLPTFAIVGGVIGVVFMSLWILVSCYEHRGTPCSGLPKCALGMLFVILSLVVVMETSLMSQFTPCLNDSSAEDYCNKIFYIYMICKEIVSALAIIFAALVYFPGSGFHTCLMDCSAPSPAGAFFSRA